MLRIRLQRFGKKNQPVFRIVLVDSHKGPKSGSFLEVLGSYNPHTKETTLKSERILHWIGEGAQASDTMNNLLIKNGVIKGSKIDVSSKKNVGKSKEGDEVSSESEEKEVEAPAPVEDKEVIKEEVKVEESEKPKEEVLEKEVELSDDPSVGEAGTPLTSGEKGDEVIPDEKKEEENKKSETKTEISSTTNEKEKN